MTLLWWGRGRVCVDSVCAVCAGVCWHRWWCGGGGGWKGEAAAAAMEEAAEGVVHAGWLSVGKKKRPCVCGVSVWEWEGGGGGSGKRGVA